MIRPQQLLRGRTQCLPGAVIAVHLPCRYLQHVLREAACIHPTLKPHHRARAEALGSCITQPAGKASHTTRQLRNQSRVQEKANLQTARIQTVCNTHTQATNTIPGRARDERHARTSTASTQRSWAAGITVASVWQELGRRDHRHVSVAQLWLSRVIQCFLSGDQRQRQGSCRTLCSLPRLPITAQATQRRDPERICAGKPPKDPLVASGTASALPASLGPSSSKAGIWAGEQVHQGRLPLANPLYASAQSSHASEHRSLLSVGARLHAWGGVWWSALKAAATRHSLGSSISLGSSPEHRRHSKGIRSSASASCTAINTYLTIALKKLLSCCKLCYERPNERCVHASHMTCLARTSRTGDTKSKRWL